MTRAPRRIIAPVTLFAESAGIVSVAAALTETLGAELVLVGIAPLAPRVRAAAQPEHTSWLAPSDQQRLLDALVRERVDELRGSLRPGFESGRSSPGARWAPRWSRQRGMSRRS